jgi:mannose-6-phosphate isomerase
MTRSAASSGATHFLPTRTVEKVWGREHLPAPFSAPQNTRIGEIWFEPSPHMPDILVKYLFTSEKLSVQVHPSDDNALEGEAGKTECWLVLDAQPGAKLAIGFDEALSAQEIREAAEDGSIEHKLTWHCVSPGDFYYLPPGTVHAIGAGLAVVEVQQTSDTTFRLYDYDRPRELHLDRAVAVAHGTPYDAQHKSSVDQQSPTLIDGSYFRVDRIKGAPEAQTVAAFADGVLVLPLEGSVTSQGKRAGAGECFYTASLDDVDFSEADVTLLIASR